MTRHRGKQLKPLVCTICPRRTFSNFDRYKWHVRNHGRKGSQFYSRSSITSRYCVHASQSGHKISLVNRRIQINQPSASWPSVKNRCERTLTCTNKKSYQCVHLDHVDRSVSHPSIIMTQSEKIIIQGKSHRCKNCMKTFSKKGYRDEHERVHTKEKPYQCAYCEKSFSRSSNKTIHERIHTKEKPYQCAYCEKSFSHSSHKTSHERIHMKEKP